MLPEIEEVLLKPGDSVRFADRDDLMETLDRLHRPIPGRGGGRRKDHREHYVMLGYLRFLSGGEAALLPLPVSLEKSPEGDDPPDFVLVGPGGERETFELTDGSTEEYQARLTKAARSGDRHVVFPQGVGVDMADSEAADYWAEVVFAAFLKKARRLEEGRYSLDHLLIYDLTGVGLLHPLEEGVRPLRERFERWYDAEKPEHRFQRISVLRDSGLLLDISGIPPGRLLQGESPYYQLFKIKARDEEDLRRRLREIDRYCRDHSIRHLRLFGSILGDREDEFDGAASPEDFFRAESDLDLLVEFEPGTIVTLSDMARMEREFGELIGFKVDLRAADDLSRYFRNEILDQAKELHAQRG